MYIQKKFGEDIEKIMVTNQSLQTKLSINDKSDKNQVSSDKLQRQMTDLNENVDLELSQLKTSLLDRLQKTELGLEKV